MYFVMARVLKYYLNKQYIIISDFIITEQGIIHNKFISLAQVDPGPV